MLEKWARKILGKIWADIPRPEAAPVTAPDLSAPEKIVPPGENAPLLDHVDFLIRAKDYIENHPVPENRIGMLNQYRHNPDSPPVGNDLSKPAITNCSYNFFGRTMISIGFPLFIEQAPLIKNNTINPAFNNAMLWESFRHVFEATVGKMGDGDTKYGYFLPMNHSYVEHPVSDDILTADPAFYERSQKFIEFYIRSDIHNPSVFLNALRTALVSERPAPAPAP